MVYNGVAPYKYTSQAQNGMFAGPYATAWASEQAQFSGVDITPGTCLEGVSLRGDFQNAG